MVIAHANLARGFRGGERQTVLLIKELAASGVDQILVCREDSPMRQMLSDIKNLEFYSSKHFLCGHFGFGKKVDLIHAHEAKGARWAWMENLLRKTKYIITRRVPNVISQAFTTRVVYKNASTVVAISTAIGDILKAYDNGLAIAKISSVATEQKVDKEISDLIRSKFAGKKIIGHIGALSDHHKGQSYIIEAAKELENVRDDLVFVFVGSGKDEAMLKELANGVKSVYFEGFQTNVADYIAAFDLFVFPSLEEGLGSTLIDVMRLEVPIIATSVGGIPELITHEETGLLIPPKDHIALADAIKRLLSDQGLVAKLIANASKKAEDFSPQNMAKKYKDLYRL